MSTAAAAGRSVSQLGEVEEKLCNILYTAVHRSSPFIFSQVQQVGITLTDFRHFISFKIVPNGQSTRRSSSRHRSIIICCTLAFVQADRQCLRHQIISLFIECLSAQEQQLYYKLDLELKQQLFSFICCLLPVTRGINCHCNRIFLNWSH